MPYDKNVVNFNVGVVGHIDSGKTSLSRALSTTASTACFDKCPQSQERGITVDLGFSSFEIPASDSERRYTTLQFTLVDCPGHASLIRTIIGGSQIIDMMLLVVDVMKGMQTQTAECLVLGEITTSKMIVVLNKVDLLEEHKRDTLVEKMRKKMEKTMEQTKFAGCPIVSVAAKPGGPTEVESQVEPVGLEVLISALRDAADIPRRDPTGPFLFAVDHCFSIRGQGTVMTGTVLSGTVAIGSNVEVASIKEVRKVKSIQMFRKSVEFVSQGDRAGICVTQFDAKLLERGLLCSPGLITTKYSAIATIRPIRFFKGSIRTKAKFHVSLGHTTVMANCHFFESTNDGTCTTWTDHADRFDWTKEYAHCDELAQEIESTSTPSRVYFALLQFERPVTVPPSSLIIGSRLDADIHLNSCRLAFEGRLMHGIEDRDYAQTLLPQLRVFKVKSKEGVVERMTDSQTVIVRSLFKKESNTQHFIGMRVRLSTGETGLIEGNFGQSGKIKIRVPEGLKDATIAALNALAKKRNKKSSSIEINVDDPVLFEPVKISLTFKRYVFDQKKNVVQSMQRHMLLLSNSSNHGSHYLEHCTDAVKKFFGRHNVTKLLFVPYALKDRDSYANKVKKAFHKFDIEVESIHDNENPVESVQQAQAIFIGGGNTFMLLKSLLDLGLIEPIRKRVLQDGIPYMGSSAGTNVSTVSICTTNDMPIVYPSTLSALNLVPFNINPHYIDADPQRRHMGETREERINQYHEISDMPPVIGLREGSWLEIDGDSITLCGEAKARIFIRGKSTQDYDIGSSLDFLFSL